MLYSSQLTKVSIVVIWGEALEDRKRRVPSSTCIIEELELLHGEPSHFWEAKVECVDSHKLAYTGIIYGALGYSRDAMELLKAKGFRSARYFTENPDEPRDVSRNPTPLEAISVYFFTRLNSLETVMRQAGADLKKTRHIFGSSRIAEIRHYLEDTLDNR